MNILLVFAVTIVAFKLAYRFYGRYIDSVFVMDEQNPTLLPAAFMIITTVASLAYLLKAKYVAEEAED